MQDVIGEIWVNGTRHHPLHPFSLFFYNYLRIYKYFTPYYQDIVIRTVIKKSHRSVEQNREREINSHVCGQIIFDEGARNTQ